jgi:lipid-A-disaccharide synthase
LAAAWLHSHRPEVQFVAPLTSEATRAQFEAVWASVAPGVPVRVLLGQSRLVLAAADAVLVASGTATLETLLSRRPMVVAYKLAPLTAWLIRRFKLVKVAFFSQPNLLLGRAAVPEFFQEQARPEALGAALLELFSNSERWPALAAEFRAVHEQLRGGGAAAAAEAICELLPAAPAR